MLSPAKIPGKICAILEVAEISGSERPRFVGSRRQNTHVFTIVLWTIPLGNAKVCASFVLCKTLDCGRQVELSTRFAFGSVFVCCRASDRGYPP